MSENLRIHPQAIQLPVDEINGQNHSALRSLWERWKRVAQKIGDFQARCLLTLFYFVGVAPFALAMRWGSDPLAIKPGTVRGWQRRTENGADPAERARRQF